METKHACAPSPTVALAVASGAKGQAIGHNQTQLRKAGERLDVVGVKIGRSSTVAAGVPVAPADGIAPGDVFRAVPLVLVAPPLRLTATAQGAKPHRIATAEPGTDDIERLAADGALLLLPAPLRLVAACDRATGDAFTHAMRPRFERHTADRARDLNRWPLASGPLCAVGAIAFRAAKEHPALGQIRRTTLEFCAAVIARTADFGGILAGHVLNLLHRFGAAVPRGVTSTGAALCCPNYTIGRR